MRLLTRRLVDYRVRWRNIPAITVAYSRKHRLARWLLPVSLPVLFLLGCSSYYHGPVSDHFDGRRFVSPEPDNGFRAHLKWLWEMETVDWPEWIDDPPQPRPPASVADKALRVTYVNHATVLIQTAGVNILTDPIWSERAGPFSWTGTKRVRAPGIKMADLPKIDVILVSHDHYDHLDLPTLRTIVERDQPTVLCGLGVGRVLGDSRATKVKEMDWWQEFTPESMPLKFIFVPAYHKSGRALLQGNRTLWGGFVIDHGGERVYFAGDSAYGVFLDAIRDHFAPFRLTVFPIGSYEKRWFMKREHMNPEDAVRAHRLLGSRQSIGMHYATFCEHPEQSIDAHERDLAEALKQQQVPANEFWVLGFGEGREVPLRSGAN